jgi:hypothetical protein
MNQSYIFIQHAFHPKTYRPQLVLLPEGANELTTFDLADKTFTVTFNAEQRFCTGWHDLATAQSYPCPSQTKLSTQYHECRQCQLKTGFNPAFYHADGISKQQRARNAQPHNLYLAHFGPKVAKVGISWSGRGLQRLLDQGARSAIVVKQFATAEEAREFEASIASLPGIVETLQTRTKKALLKQPYDAELGHQELHSLFDMAVRHTQLETAPPKVLCLDPHYLASHQLQPNQLIDISSEPYISGAFIGMIGPNIIMEQDGTQFLYSIGQKRGYRLTISDSEQPNNFAPQQVSLF